MHEIIVIAQNIVISSWEVLQEAAVYIIFGLLMGGLLKVFITPATVAAHLGRGRVRPVLKAALFGIPIPLCSCSVLPAAASLKKQGANNGATMAFLISTPESGVDSISISWALLDPLMTIVRPVAAFVSAFVAGTIENFRHSPSIDAGINHEVSSEDESCCNETECSGEKLQPHHSLFAKIVLGVRYAISELWGDIAGPFFIGVVLAGIMYILIPDDFLVTYLGGGLHSMLIMLVVGIPLYICATASTPIAAALILKGVSPGAALVFLLVGPATNIMSLSVLIGLLGKRATGVYLVSIAVVSVLFGLALDSIYAIAGMSAIATIGTATELVPIWIKNISAAALILMSVPLGIRTLRKKFVHPKTGCGCGATSCSSTLQDNLKIHTGLINHK